MILVRLLAYLRRHWPSTHILVRGDSHFATPEVIEVIAHRRLIDFVFGFAGNAVLAPPGGPRHAGGTLSSSSSGPLWRRPMASALPPAAACMRSSPMPPPRGLSRGASSSKPKSWPLGDNPRFVVTSLEAPTPQQRV